MKKRFKAQSQGDIQIVWNVVDTKTSSYRAFAIVGRDARAKAVALAKKLNSDRRYK